MKSKRLIIGVTVDEVRSAVTSSVSMREAVGKLGLIADGRTYIRIREICDDNNIDHSFPTRHSNKRVPTSELLVENCQYKLSVKIKKRLLDEGYLENKCSMDGCPSPESIWNSKPLVLQLDHINGISNDNRIENLRILCPNCHSQTETYARGGITGHLRAQKVKHGYVCGTPRAYADFKCRCEKCVFAYQMYRRRAAEYQEIVKFPGKRRAKQMIEELGPHTR